MQYLLTKGYHEQHKIERVVGAALRRLGPCAAHPLPHSAAAWPGLCGKKKASLYCTVADTVKRIAGRTASGLSAAAWPCPATGASPTCMQQAPLPRR